MKKLFLFLFSLAIVLVSCSNIKAEVENLLLKEDIQGAKILEYGLVDNSSFSIRFSEKVEVKEIVFNGVKKKKQLLGDSITIPLPYTLEMGEKYTLALTFTKNGGNTTRAFFTFYGKNDRKAGLVISELSVAGTKTNPDRIELYVRSGGNTAGIMLTDELGITGIVLPSLEVNEDDIIVVYWDSRSRQDPFERNKDNPVYTYFVDGGMDHTLISTTGAVLLYDEVGGEITDAILYSDFTEAAEKKETFIQIQEYLEETGEWIGDPVSSEDVTSTRVLARYPTTEDSNSADEWITTTTKGSSFGYPNPYNPYEDE